MTRWLIVSATSSTMILNRVVGTGVFVVPAPVLAISGSKGMSIILWLISAITTWAGFVATLVLLRLGTASNIYL